MDRTATRTNSQFARIRKHERKAYRGLISVFVPRTINEQPPDEANASCTPAWSYSLSQGGVGMVSLERIELAEIWVGVHLPNASIRWMFGRVVRRRPIPETEFFDYGVSFIRHTPEPTDDAP